MQTQQGRAVEHGGSISGRTDYISRILIRLADVIVNTFVKIYILLTGLHQHSPKVKLSRLWNWKKAVNEILQNH